MTMKIGAVILAAVVMGQPAAAFERMMRSDCQVAFERAAELAGESDDRVARMSQSTRVTPDGWCQMRGGDAGLENANFDTFEWRAEKITQWTRDGIPPLAIQLRVSGLDPDQMQGGVSTDRPPVTLNATVRQLPDTGQIVVERAALDNDAGDSLSFTGVFERVFLSSTSMMQVSMGSATFKAGLMALTLEGGVENPFGMNFEIEVVGTPQARFEGVFNGISALPEGVIDPASRAELTAFADDLPKPVGRLEVSAMSQRGLGLMQIGMSMYSSFVTIVDDGAISNEMEILFDGLTVEADWTPAVPVTE